MKKLMAKAGAVMTVTLAALPAYADTHGQIVGNACTFLQNISGCSSGQSLLGPNGNDGYLNTLVDDFIYATVIVATIFIFIGGFNYITSEGDSQKTARAKQTIRYAIISIVIAGLARAIVAFVAFRVKA